MPSICNHVSSLDMFLLTCVRVLLLVVSHLLCLQGTKIPSNHLSLSPSSLSYVISYVLKRVIRCSIKQPHKASCSRHYWKSPKTTINQIKFQFQSHHSIATHEALLPETCPSSRDEGCIILWRLGGESRDDDEMSDGMTCILTARRASGFAYASASQNKTKVSVITSVLTPKKHENTC